MANHDTYEKDILKALQKIGIQMEAVNKNLIKLAEAIQSINTGSLVDPCIGVDMSSGMGKEFVEHNCNTCNYRDLDVFAEPCDSCGITCDKWEAKE